VIVQAGQDGRSTVFGSYLLHPYTRCNPVMHDDPNTRFDGGERHLTLTPLQATMLVQAQQQVTTAQAQLELVASTILAGFGIRQAQILRVENGEQPALVIRQNATS